MAEDSVNQERALEAIESADPELSNALQRLAEEEEQALQHALRDPAAVPAPPDFLDKVMARVKAEDSVDRERALEAIESADPELSNALQRLAEEEEQALQHALRDPAAVPAPPDFLDKVMARVKAEDSNQDGPEKVNPPPPPPWWERIRNLFRIPEGVTVGQVFAYAGAPLVGLFIFYSILHLPEYFAPIAHADDDVRARQHFSDKEYDESERLYSNLVKTNPNQIGYLAGLATATWYGKKYEASKRFYLNIAEVALTQAATAAWYECKHQEAKEIIEERSEEKKRTAGMLFTLGIAYHSLRDLSAAERNYRQIVDSAQEDQSPRLVESAWFNLGIIHAARSQNGEDEGEHTLAIAALEKSIERADNKEERIKKIRAALQPFDKRSENKCGIVQYLTEDLTPLAESSELTSLLERFS